MKNACVSKCLVALLLTLPVGAAPVEGDGFFNEYTPASFRKLSLANATIEPRDLNLALLDAAVFHETNRRRKTQGLRAFRYDSKVRDAAAIQSKHMARTGDVTHHNPNRNASGVVERAELAGLPQSALIAENVASAFGRRYRSGGKFYARDENGRTIYSYEPNGPPIPMHTYVSFARALVDSWMQSPEHRRNILAKDATYLGTSCMRGQEPTAMETFYCTQVFFRPLE